ncbi:MAG: tetratricopeptide repeat protein [Pirellulaceae bacterium]
MPRFLATILLLLAMSPAASPVLSQDEPDKGKKDEKPKVKPLPDDRRLMTLHFDFVKKAEKLANEYEGDKDWGKARTVYEEILKLVPQYPNANAKLAEMIQREAGAQKTLVTVKADTEWQDSGIELIEGKPIIIQVTGTWVFHLEVETTADGLTIPKELRDFPLGCLVGMIPSDDPKLAKPFVLGSGKQFISDRSGKLFLRMYDTDPRDNRGSLKVEIHGTFKGGK